LIGVEMISATLSLIDNLGATERRVQHGRSEDALAALIAEADARAGCSWAGLARRINDLGAGQGLALRYDYTSVHRWVKRGEKPRSPVTADELHATHAFQARTDLLLRPLPHLSVVEIVDGVRDETFVADHATGQPFHTAVSYLLVSMECLIGAAYTK